MAVSTKSLSEKTTPIYSAFWQYFVIFVMTFFFAVGSGMRPFIANIGPLLYLGWAAGGLAFLLYMEGIKHVQGQLIQIITMLEMLVATFSGVFLLGEKLSLYPIYSTWRGVYCCRHAGRHCQKKSGWSYG